MTPAVILRPEASKDLADAYRWYEDKRHGLGEEFLLVVDAAIEKIHRSPDAYPIIHRNVRRVLTRRFPYGIFYVVEPERIVILAIFHGNRDPRVARKRH